MDEMDRLADLKVALSPTEGPSDRLRDWVLTGMTGEPAPGPTRRRWVAPAVVVAGVAIMAAGAVALGVSGGTPSSGTPSAGELQPAAFAVNVNADGSVTFTAHDVVDPAAATLALNDAGIAGRVINDITPGCSTHADDIAPADLHPDDTIGRGLGASDTVTFRSTDYPPGGGLLVVVTSDGGDSGRPVPPDPVSVAIFAFDDEGKVPTCVDFADAGTGTP